MATIENEAPPPDFDETPMLPHRRKRSMRAGVVSTERPPPTNPDDLPREAAEED